MELVVAKKSTWSIRVFICMKMLGLSPKLTVVDLDNEDDRSVLRGLSETKLVPVLIAGQLKIHDSLAITEYLNELKQGLLYPEDANERALARSLCAELHAGFVNLRTDCPFTFESMEKPKITPLMREEIERLTMIWSRASQPFMFDRATAVDAFYAVMTLRLKNYGIGLDGKAGEFQSSLLSWELFKDVIEEAKAW